MPIPGQAAAPWGHPAPLLPALTWEPGMKDMPLETPGKPSKMAATQLPDQKETSQ